MTDPQAPETANPSHAARLWLALLLALLVVMLPGPQVTATASQSKQLTTPTLALTAIHGRDLIARKDAVQIRPLAATALPPPEPLPPPPRTAASVAYAHQPQIGVCACTLVPCARAPPSFRMTA
ncbi:MULTISPECIES: hypothetical protein [Paracoccus]|jgi:hypothetical protein|uniref:hypothetical protein n=1 Tax=Paracoccus TaxID=265 RepID=UPI001E2AB2FD|nr:MULTISPECIES: hypothetical protein [Paracoccus]UFS63924.1 hypothetical protein LO749_06985 [Paracoccus denitrificans]